MTETEINTKIAELEKQLEALKEDKKNRCVRCNKKKGTHWGERWYAANISLQAPAQIFAILHSGKSCADDEDFNAWKKNNTTPIVKKNDAQHVVFNYGGEIPMCRECHHELVELIGKFFRY